jgi:hypothetical protein
MSVFVAAIDITTQNFRCLLLPHAHFPTRPEYPNSSRRKAIFIEVRAVAIKPLKNVSFRFRYCYFFISPFSFSIELSLPAFLSLPL